MTNYIEDNREIFSKEIERETVFSGEISRSAETIKIITPLESCYAVDSDGLYAQDTINERAKGWQIFN